MELSWVATDNVDRKADGRKTGTGSGLVLTKRREHMAAHSLQFSDLSLPVSPLTQSLPLTIRLDYQPLFGKWARAPQVNLTREIGEIEPLSFCTRSYVLKSLSILSIDFRGRRFDIFRERVSCDLLGRRLVDSICRAVKHSTFLISISRISHRPSLSGFSS